MTEHISTALSTILLPCPLCGARPLQPCMTVRLTNRQVLRYTHAERNR